MHVKIHSKCNHLAWTTRKCRLNELLLLWQNVECNLNQAQSIITNYFIDKFHSKLSFLIDNIVNNKQWYNNKWFEHLSTAKTCGFTFVTYVWLFFETHVDDSVLDLQLYNNVDLNNVCIERKLVNKNSRFTFKQLKQFLLQLKCVIGARETMHQLLFNHQICDITDIHALTTLIKKLPNYTAPLPNINTMPKVFSYDVILYISLFINDYSSLLAWIKINRRWFKCLMSVSFATQAPLLRYENVTDLMILKYNNKISNDFLLRGSLSAWIYASFRSNELTGNTFSLERPLLIAYAGSIMLLSYLPHSLKQIRYIYDVNQERLHRIYHWHRWLNVYVAALKRKLLFFSIENNTTNHFPFVIPAVTVLFFKSIVKINCLASLVTVKHSQFWILQDVLFDNDVDMHHSFLHNSLRQLLSSKKYSNKQIYVLDNIKHNCQYWNRLQNCLNFGNIFNYVVKLTILMRIDNADYLLFSNFLQFLSTKKGALCDIVLLFECDKHHKSLCNHSHLHKKIQRWINQDLHAILNNKCIKSLWVAIYLVYGEFETGDAINLKTQTAIAQLFKHLTVDECDTEGLLRVRKLCQLVTKNLFK